MGIGKSFKKAVRKVTSPLNKLGPVGDIAAAIALTAAGQPELIPLVVGAKTYGQTGNPLAALISAGSSYAGAKIGGNLLGDTLGTVASNTGIGALPWSTAANTISQPIGSLIGQQAAGVIGSTPIGSLIGSHVATSLAQNAFTDSAPAPQVSAPAAPMPAGPAPFKPQQMAEKDLPSSLTSTLGSLTSEQKSTNLANQGVYGGGLGPLEQEYYVNQAQRRLVDPAGQVGDPKSIFNPIEQSYLQKLGLGGYSSGLNLAELISQWRPAYG